MAEQRTSPPVRNPTDDFSRTVGRKERRRLRARRHRNGDLWTGFRMMGLVGWAVAVPTLLGATLGMWIDRRWPGHYSWTLMLLLGGILLGCWNAWYWVARETAVIRAPEEDEVDDHRDA